MPYRDGDRLGPQLSEHKLSGSGSASWLGAGLLGTAMVPLFLCLAFSGRHVSVKLMLGSVMMGALALWALAGWWRLRGITLYLHERGFRYRSQSTVEISVPFEEIAAMEARYVPGLRKRGTADDGNRVTLLVRTSSGVILDVPKELDGFHQLVATLEQRSGRAPLKILIDHLMQR